MQSKSILAKLLARENITIQHGNYETAFFDTEQRMLGLPLLKEMDKNLYDLFIGHEVGHALETPSDGWHNSTFDIPGCPRAFVNVIEDIRIEKLIQRRYPGLTHSFKKGYKNLMDSDFFGIGKTDINTMSFMNRLNLKSKLRDLVDVSFTEEEQPYVKMAMAVETWDDVIVACRAIYEYLKEKQENEQKKKQEQGDSADTTEQDGGAESSQDSIDEGDEHEEGEGTEMPSGNADGNDDSDSSAEDDSLDSMQDNDDSLQDSEFQNRSAIEENSEESESGKELEVSGPKGAEEPFTVEQQDIMDVSTDDAFRENESKLVERDRFGNIPRVINTVSTNQINDMIISYEEIAEARKKIFREVFEQDTVPSSFHHLEYDSEYKSFIDETTKIVNVMVKEFEMRKAAFQYSRSKTSRSGSLNVNKLHEYKFNDDIFRKVTKLADAKSHGMVMLIDRSGSMRGVLADVTRQVLTLAMFCKKVGIPFDVYTFASLYDTCDNTHSFKLGDMNHQHTKMCHMLSSSFKKGTYNQAFRELFNQTVGRLNEQYMLFSDPEIMGGTPLVEVLSAMPEVLSQFKNRHGVQKVIMPLLTDGDASPFSYIVGTYDGGYPIFNPLHYGSFVFNMGGSKQIKAKEVNVVNKLLENIRSMGVTTVGYFLAQSSGAFNSKVGYASGSWNKETFKAVNKIARAQKFVSYDNVLGYDRYFIMKVADDVLSTEIDEFTIKDGARGAEITRAFKKYASAKKTNRLFAAQFAEIVS